MPHSPPLPLEPDRLRSSAGSGAAFAAAFTDERMVGLTCGIAALVPFLLPRLDLTARFGGTPVVYPYELDQILLCSLWGGLLATVPGLAGRDAGRAARTFFAGWMLTAAGFAFWNPRPEVYPGLQIGLDLLGFRDPRNHILDFLDRMVRLTETPLSLALLVGLQGWSARAGVLWTILALAAVEVVLPIAWLLSAMVQAAFMPKAAFAQSIGFILGLGIFALWGALPWWVFRAGNRAVPGNVERPSSHTSEDRPCSSTV